jgi:hypothetical protein
MNVLCMFSIKLYAFCSPPCSPPIPSSLARKDLVFMCSFLLRSHAHDAQILSMEDEDAPEEPVEAEEQDTRRTDDDDDDDPDSSRKSTTR